MTELQTATRDDVQGIVHQLATIIERSDYASAAHEFVTDLAVRYDCERVSLGWMVGNHVVVQATSHTDRPDSKSQLVRAIAHAMEETVDQQEILSYPADDSPTTAQPRILRRHGELAAQPGSGSICSIPVSDCDGVFGVLTLENVSGRQLSEATLRACEATLLMAAPVLNLKWRDQRWLAVKALETVRRGWRSLRRPGSDGRKIVAGCGVLLFLFLFLGKGDYRVPVDAQLEGSIQRAAVAPFDGYVGEASIRAGDIVKSTTVLCSLDRRELELELNRWSSEQDKLTKQRRKALAEMDAVQLRVITAEIEQVEARRALVEFKLDQTEIFAPFEGVVVSGDLSQSIGAPVERGDVLFEVAPLDSFRLILEVDERDIDEIEKGQTGRLVLSALPGDPVEFTVVNITPVSTPEDGRNFFRVEAEIPEAIMQDLRTDEIELRPGMKGRAKIEIGRRRQIWLWTHDVIDWVRLGLWSWLP